MIVNRDEKRGRATSFADVADAYERATFSFVQRLHRATLLDLVLSRSYCAVRTEEERAPVLERAARIFDEHADGGAIELPYVTECFRTEKCRPDA